MANCSLQPRPREIVCLELFLPSRVYRRKYTYIPQGPPELRCGAVGVLRPLSRLCVASGTFLICVLYVAVGLAPGWLDD